MSGWDDAPAAACKSYYISFLRYFSYLLIVVSPRWCDCLLVCLLLLLLELVVCRRTLIHYSYASCRSLFLFYMLFLPSPH